MKNLVVPLSLLLGSGSIVAQTPTLDEMWELIQKQQIEIQQLKAELASTDDQLKITDLKVEATADALEQESTDKIQLGWATRTQIRGYGEHHYNNFEDTNDQVDAHRFVLFVGHQFNDKVRMFSELEIEHGLVVDTADGSGPGEVELEQAYIEWDFAERHRLQLGQFLIPVGIINETHEPTTFYGVERNPVEKDIIPATWWETGAQVMGEITGGFSYNVALHSGLKTSDGGKIRSGRQKSAKATADELAFTARLKYTAIPGLELAATLQLQQSVTQGLGIGDNEATLFETHAAYRNGPLGLRALYAAWNIDGDTFETMGRDEQEGFFLEGSYQITPKLGAFVRYNEWDNSASGNLDTALEQWDFGFNYWLHDGVVLKLDYSDQEAEDGDNGKDAINLGVGWNF